MNSDKNTQLNSLNKFQDTNLSKLYSLKTNIIDNNIK